MDEEEKKKNNSSKYFWIILILIFIIGIIWFAYPYFENTSNDLSDTSKTTLVDTTKQVKKNHNVANSIPKDSNSRYVILSNSENEEVPWLIDDKAGKPYKRVFTGRRINIAIIGVDSRMGTTTKHADANHILSILIDSGYAEIISIPRDTPAEAGYDDSTGQNKLTIVYAAKGREAYFKEAARIAGIDKIHHYVEFSFSQAMGVMDLLGYKDPASTLQVLRSRTGLGGDDFQRCYNQGQFIRQMLLKHFDKFTGFFGGLLIRGGLAFVKTDMNYDMVKNIVDKFNEKKFPRSKDDITVRVRPPLGRDYKIYDFTEQKTFDGLKKKIENFNQYKIKNDTTAALNGRFNPSPRLWSVLNSAIQDSAKKPQNVINKLKVYYEQRAWMQVSNISERNKMIDLFETLLVSAYNKKKQHGEAEKVRETIEVQKKLWATPIFRNNGDTNNH